MVVAPNLPVDVLLGTDLYEASVFKGGQVEHGLAGVQRRGKEQKKRKKQRWEDKELRGKEDNDETEDEANLVQEKTFGVETLHSQVEGQPEGELVVQRAVECQEGMTEDKEDGETK